MKSTRKLSLKRERLTELSADQLDGLAGGLNADTAIYIRTGSGYATCGCPSHYHNCPSVDVQPCATYRTACPSEYGGCYAAIKVAG